ncbi:MAG: nucleotide exchange factor GrpE [Phaeodactylibacter sp.]|uniref:nucleotide exchange factor GrpE n=1 Tax=Phaeodactylibacter sp. TaxID=1940289 RepID=UPI0032ED5A49
MSEHKEHQEEVQDQDAAAAQEATREEAAAGESHTQEAEGDLSLDDQLSAKDKQLEELKDKHLRLMAEFENFKRRSVREKMDMMKNAAKDTMTALLPVLDDFDRARKAADDNDKGDLFAEGMGLVYKKLYSTLEQKGLKPMETNGEAFDPELHEAVTEIPASSEEQKGKIIDTVEKGYWLNDKIIRHAKVVVGK